jgi:cell division transport system permease protein
VIHPALSALRRTGSLATRRPRAALWTLLALSCALFAVAIAATAATAIDRFAAAHPGSDGNMVVYLGEGVSEARATALVRELRALRGVVRAELVSGAESASRLSRALGSDPALLDGVDLASLPASVEVALAPGVREVVAMSPTVRALRGAPGVADVVVTDDEDERIAFALHIARAVAWTGAVLFAGLALLIVLAAVRLGLARSPVEAAVHRLLGAPPGFIAIPSALAGALQGTVAAVVAAGALGLVLHGRGGALTTIELASPPAFALAGLVAIGGLVGFIGGGLAGVARAQ